MELDELGQMHVYLWIHHHIKTQAVPNILDNRLPTLPRLPVCSLSL